MMLGRSHLAAKLVALLAVAWCLADVHAASPQSLRFAGRRLRGPAAESESRSLVPSNNATAAQPEAKLFGATSSPTPGNPNTTLIGGFKIPHINQQVQLRALLVSTCFPVLLVLECHGRAGGTHASACTLLDVDRRHEPTVMPLLQQCIFKYASLAWHLSPCVIRRLSAIRGTTLPAPGACMLIDYFADFPAPAGSSGRMQLIYSLTKAARVTGAAPSGPAVAFSDGWSPRHSVEIPQLSPDLAPTCPT